MAEAFAIAAAVFQFLDMSCRLSVKLKWLCTEVKGVPETLRDLSRDLSFQDAIAKNVLANIDAISSPSMLADLEQILQKHAQTMSQLSQVLDKYTSDDKDGLLKRGWTSIRAIHGNSEMIRLCQELEREKGAISLCLSTASLSVFFFLTRATKPVTAVL